MGLDAFDASGLGAFIASGLGARGVELAAVGLPDVVFGGSFTSFGGETVSNVCFYNVADDTIDTEPGGGSFRYDKFLLYTGDNKLYGIENRDFNQWRPSLGLWSQKQNGVNDMCNWNGVVALALNTHVRTWNGSSITTLPTPSTPAGFDSIRLNHCASVTIDGTEMLVVAGYAQITTEEIIWASIWDGSNWVFDLLDDYPSPGSASAMTNNGGIQSIVVIDDKIWFSHNIGVIGSGGFNGTNGHDRNIRWDPAGGTYNGWSALPTEFRSDLTAPGAFSNVDELKLFNGCLYSYGDSGTWSFHLIFPNFLNTRLVRMGSPVVNNGTTITDFNGHINPRLFEVADDLIWSSADAPAQQVDGSIMNDGETLRLITFDGSTWSAYPAQPDDSFCSAVLFIDKSLLEG